MLRRGKSRVVALTGLVAVVLLLAGGVFALWRIFVPAAPVPDRLTLARAAYRDLEGWAEDRQGQAVAALRRSCAVLERLPDERPIGPGGVGGRAFDWRAPCAAAARLDVSDDRAARAFFERWFIPFTATNSGRPEGLFTGYYEPSLNGALQPDEVYATPLLARPPDLVRVDLGEFRADWRGQRIAGRVVDGRLRPYPSRAEIEAGALSGRGLELIWVDDPVDAFFLHIQGSGRVRLRDGRELRLGYDGQNGRAYTSVGRILVEQGALDRDTLSMQSIREWLETHRARARELLDKNSSYVFFRILDGDGPIGAQNVVLTPARSLAVDRRFMPLGAPVWLETAAPAADGGGMQPLRRLLIAQDTGGAIRGPVRGDVFWGAGEAAAAVAGRMKSPGRYYLLLPRAVAARRAGGDS